MKIMNDYLREMCSYPGLYYRLLKVKIEVKPKRIDYGEDRHQYLYHFAPEGEAKDKVVVWIHGGGWNSGSPNNFKYVGQFFARQGYHCISLGYRLSPKNKYPVQIEDVCAAYRKGVEYLEAEGVDCSKIVVTGPSAGGHLSTILCYSKEDQERYQVDAERMIGCISVAGPCYFGGELSWTLRTLFGQLFAKGYDWKKGEPYSLMTKNHIPLLLIHSRHDGLVDFEMSEKLYEKAMELGMECELYEVVDKKNTHSVYSAGMFLETRETNQGLNKLFSWVEELS